MKQMISRLFKYILFTFRISVIICIVIIPAGRSYAAILDAPAKISDIFPDSNLASAVADRLSMNTSDTVSQNNLNSITSLNLMNSGISDITGIGYLTGLNSLDLGYNQISAIPQEIGDLSNLTYLSLSFNQINQIPASIGGLTRLNYLLLDNNLIASIPSGAVSTLTNLKLINISYNSVQDLSQIEGLPSSVMKNCIGQSIKIIEQGYFEQNPTIAQKIDMPEIYWNNSAALLSGSCIINSDKTSINVPVNSLGANVVKLSLTSGLGKNSILEIDYVVKDTTPPNPPVINPLLNNSIGNSQKPVINGTSEASSKITVYITGATSTTGSTTADNYGKWSYTPSVNLNVGQNVITATATDASNNTSMLSGNTIIKIDITLSNTPVINASLNNLITAISRPVINGTAISYSVITVSIDGIDDLNTATADVYGNWSFTPSKILSDGKHSFIARPKGAAKTLALMSNTITLTVKTKPPAQPLIDPKLNNSVTNNAVPVISGTAEIGSQISIHMDSSDLINCTTTNSAGKWSYSLSAPLSEGKHTISARATDAAGNIGAYSSPAYLTVDTTPPSAPVLDAALNNALLNNTKPVISGIAEANSKVTVILDGAPLLSPATADSTGKWKYTPSTALLEGRHIITAKAADVAGNSSPFSSPAVLTVDITPPGVPVITMPANNTATNNNKPVISGTTDINSVIILGIDSQYSLTPIIPDSSGNWSYTPSLALNDGSHKLTAKARDAAGNISSASPVAYLTVMTKAPQNPVIDQKLNNIITNISKPTINGTSDANTKITINIDNGIIIPDCTTSDSSGKWSYTLANPMADGKHTIAAMAKNIFSMTSPYSAAAAIAIDTLPPGVPVIDAAFVNAVLNSQKPTITGTAEAGSKVLFTVDGVEDTKNMALCDSSQHFKYTPSINLKDGLHSITAKAVDSAANKSSNSPVIQIAINTTPPNVPRITSPLNGSQTTNPKPVIIGTSELNTVIIITIDGVDSKTQITTDGSGRWSYTPETNIADGKHRIFVKAKNSANNISPASESVNITIDSTPPKSPVINVPVDNSITSDQRLIVSGTAEVRSKVTLNIDGKIYNDIVTADSSGKWNYVYPIILSVGKHTVAAKARDDLGNESLYCPAVTVNIDLTAPAIAIVSPGNKDLISSTNPVISGTSEPDSKIVLTIDGKDTTTPIVADSDGNWSFKCTTKLVEGNHLVSARARDTANNQSIANPSITFTVDINPPEAPLILTPQDGAVLSDTNLQIEGTAEPDSVISIVLDGEEQTDVVSADDNGKWNFEPGFGEGKHSIAAKAKDMAGNISSLSKKVNLDIEILAAPVVNSPQNDMATSDPRPKINGIAEPNSKILIQIDNAKTNEAVPVDPKGNWSYKPGSDLTVGKHTLTFSATNALKAVSAESSIVITVNKKTALNKPRTVSPLIKAPANNSVVKTRRPVIKGTASPGSKLQLLLKIGKSTITAVISTDKKGNWTFTSKRNLITGKYAASIKDISPAGRKTSGASITFKIVK